MYTLERYEKHIHYLSNSLTVKLLDIGIAINKGLLLKYGIPPSKDKLEWKYFQNIAGIRHSTNNVVMITTIEDNSVIELTKEAMEDYPFTKEELLKNTNMYNELVSRYPNDILYIKGCLYPVDITTAINAEEGTILSYNPTFIEESEYSLIKELEQYTKSYFKRWHVNAYTITDELYLPSMLAVMYANIPNKIKNIRLDKINTPEVHSFHMEQYFRSHMNIWDDIDVLNNSSKYWLYKNIRYLLKHVGQEKTFEIILDKIFHANGIGVGEYLLKTPVSKNVNVSDLKVPTFTNTEVKAISNALNKSYQLDKEAERSIDYIVNLELEDLKQLDTSAVTDQYGYINDSVVNNLKSIPYEELKTKILDVNTNKMFEMLGVDLYKFVIDNWILSVKYNNYNTVVDYSNPTGSSTGEIRKLIDYIEPNTSQIYTITPKAGLLMLIKLLLVLTDDISRPIGKLITSTVLTTDDVEIDTALTSIYNDGYIVDLFNSIRTDIPVMPDLISRPSEFNTYLTKAINFYKYLWVLDSNVENTLLSSSMKQLLGKLVTYDTYDLTVNNEMLTIDELLQAEGVSYNVDNSFDIALSVTKLIKSFTMIDVDIYTNLKDKLTKYRNILNKLTSYTVQVLTDNDSVNAVFPKYNNIGNIRSKNGLIKVMDGYIIPLEQEYTKIRADGNDWHDYLWGRSNSNTPLAVMCDKVISGSMEILPDEDYDTLYVLEPNFIVNVHQELRCDARYIRESFIFITSVTGELYPLDTTPMLIESGGSNEYDPMIAVDDIPVPYVFIQDDTVTGYVAGDTVQTDDVEVLDIDISVTVEDL